MLKGLVTVGNLIAFGLLAWGLTTMFRAPWYGYASVLAFMVLTVLNIIAAHRAPPTEKGRLGRMWGLWLDVKEAELKTKLPDKADHGAQSQ